MKTLPKSLFFTLILLQLIGWTLIPTLTRLSLPIDAIEGYVWGQHFEWGYDRNPWMNALLTHWAVIIGGKSAWLVYACSQIFICLGYWAVWSLAKKITRSEPHALISVLMLVGIQYTSLAAVDFNDNVIELGLWPLMAYLGYQAYFSEASLLYWSLTGIVAGLALMTKYYGIMPILSLGLFFIFTPKTHHVFKELGIYLAAILCFLICLPHLLWLPAHDFITVTYAAKKAHQILTPSWANHFPFLFFIFTHTFYAIHFEFAQLSAFMGSVLLLAFGLMGRSKNPLNFPSVEDLSLRFLQFAALGPFLLTLLASVIFGWELNTMWGTPLLSLWPLWFLCQLKPRLNQRAPILIGIAALCVFILLLTGFAVHNLRDQGTFKNVNGQQYSDAVNHSFEKTFHTPIKFITGDRYLAGYVAFYADHPIQIRISE